MKVEDLIASLTIEQARKYQQAAEPILWVEYNLLDPNNISRRYTTRVEIALLTLLQDNKD